MSGRKPLLVVAYLMVASALIADWCDNWPISYSASQGDLEAVKTCIDAGRPVTGGHLVSAIRGRNIEILRLLLDNGADPNYTGIDGPILFTAVRYGDVNAIRLLVGYGTEVDAGTASGETPLISAARYGLEDVIRTLVELGADLEAQFHIHNNLSGTALVRAAFEERPGAVRTLLELGADPDARGMSGMTALAWSAVNGDLESARHLVEAGAASNILGTTSMGFTYSAISAARDYGATEILDLLLSRSARTEEAPEGAAITTERIGRVVIDREALDQRLADIRAANAETLARKWTELEATEAHLLDLAGQITVLRQRMSTLLADAETSQARLEDLRDELNRKWEQAYGELSELTLERKSQLEREIRDLEDYIIGRRTREDGSVIRQPPGNTTDWIRALDGKKAELEIINSRPFARHDYDAEFADLNRQISNAIASRAVALDALNDAGRQRVRLEDELSEGQLALADMEREYSALDLQMSMGIPSPAILDVTATSGGRVVYSASTENDEFAADAYRSEIRALDVQLRAQEALLSQMQSQRTYLGQKRSEWRTQLDRIRSDIRQSGDTVASVISSNAYARVVTRVAAEGANVALALAGGPGAAVAQLGSTIVSGLAADWTGFETFDESELRARFEFADPEQPSDESFPLGDAVGSSFKSLAQGAGISLLKEVPLQALQADASLRTANTWLRPRGDVASLLAQVERDTALLTEQIVAGSGSRLALSRSVDSAVDRLADVASLRSIVEDRYMEAQRFFAQHGSWPDDIDAIRQNLQRARNATGAATAVVADATQELHRAHASLEKLSERITRAEANLDRIRRVNVWELGKSLGVDLAIAAAEQVITGWLDSREYDAWLEFFRDEVRMKIALRNLRELRIQYEAQNEATLALERAVAKLQRTRAYYARRLEEQTLGIGSMGQDGLMVQTHEIFVAQPGDTVVVSITASDGPGVAAMLHGVPMEAAAPITSDGLTTYRFSLPVSALLPVAEGRHDMGLAVVLE